MSNGAIIFLMAALFLGLGYLGVPVAFSIIAGVLVATALTKISFASMIGQLFHGIDSEALLAVPFFLLVGELMTSAQVTHRMIVLAQTIVGHFRGGIVPGLLVGFGIMIYSHFFGPVGVLRPRATFRQFTEAAKLSALPLMIPIIIMGGILSGFFTPTEAGLVAVAYITFVLIPLVNRGHIKHLPRDFANAGLLYSIPMAAVAAASAFGWMLAYLKGPEVVAGWIQGFAGDNALIIMFLLVVLFVIIGDFMDAVPAIIIFMPIIAALTELGQINPVHMGVVIVTTLAFGLITPPYGLSLLMASKFVGVSFMKAVVSSLPLYLVFFATIAFCIFFPKVVLFLPKTFLPESVGCFRNPSGPGYICPQF